MLDPVGIVALCLLLLALVWVIARVLVTHPIIGNTDWGKLRIFGRWFEEKFSLTAMGIPPFHRHRQELAPWRHRLMRSRFSHRAPRRTIDGNGRLHRAVPGQGAGSQSRPQQPPVPAWDSDAPPLYLDEQNPCREIAAEDLLPRRPDWFPGTTGRHDALGNFSPDELASLEWFESQFRSQDRPDR